MNNPVARKLRRAGMRDEAFQIEELDRRCNRLEKENAKFKSILKNIYEYKQITAMAHEEMEDMFENDIRQKRRYNRNK